MRVKWLIWLDVVVSAPLTLVGAIYIFLLLWDVWKVSVCPQAGRGRLVPHTAGWRVGHRAKGHMGISYTGGAASLKLFRHCSKAWMVSIELGTKGAASILEISVENARVWESHKGCEVGTKGLQETCDVLEQQLETREDVWGAQRDSA